MHGDIGIALDIGQAVLSHNIQIPFDIWQAMIPDDIGIALHIGQATLSGNIQIHFDTPQTGM